ncbi:NTF2 fold immunity protein [Pseudomonas sp. Teo4]|uniref:NTF2 fold immunity protein n=1 Tax=Pseudomonas sp. Teo4 TaxID=3064528 RepID=UPI002ABA3E9C|nr:NTF2 fold immunity protein [Pseudomonas sp. Teo4]MDZ3991664.1 Immunity protein RhsIA [Pseudomonas sp. Teo4]
MAKSDIKENVPESLKKFMQEMNEWECEFFEKRKDGLSKGVDDLALKENYALKLERILDAFALKDKSNYGRLIDLGCTRPATYDPKTDEVELISSSDGSMIVQVQQMKGAEVCSRFHLVVKGGEWKIRKREMLNFDEKWKRVPL